MSTPADFKRAEDKKKKQPKMARTVAAIPQYHTSLATSSTPPMAPSNGYNTRNNGSWMYQNQPNHRQNEFGRNGPNGYDFTRDSYSGGWMFTDFSHPAGGRQPFRPQQNYKNNKQKKKNTQPAASANAPPSASKTELALPVAPISMDTMDFVIQPENLVCFSGKLHFLSNMYRCKLVIDNNMYSSVEHYYQSTKVFTFIGPQGSQQMKGLTNGAQVKAESHRLLKNIAKGQIEEWKLKEAPKIINYAIHEKFKQNPELKAQLAATGSAILAQSFAKDNVYATAAYMDEVKEWAKANAGQIYRLPVDCHDSANIDFIPLVAKGRNLLGALLMLTRRDLADVPAKQPAMQVSMLQAEANRAADLMNALNL